MITCLFWGYKSRKSAKSAKKGPPDFVFCSVCRRQDLCRQASVFEMDAYAIRSLSWEYRIVSHNSFIFVCSRNKGLIGRYSPVTLMKWMFTYSAICTIPFSYNSVASIDFATLPLDIYLNIAVVVLGGTFFAYLLVPIGQRILRPTVATMYNYVQPIIASIITVIVGLDTFGLMKSIAIALVFLGVYIVTRSKSKEQLKQLKGER